MKEDTNQSLDLFSHLEIPEQKPEEPAPQDLPLLSFAEGPLVLGTTASSPQEEVLEESYGSSFYEEDDFSENQTPEFVSSPVEASTEIDESTDQESMVGTPDLEEVTVSTAVQSENSVSTQVQSDIQIPTEITELLEKPSAPKRKREERPKEPRDSAAIFLSLSPEQARAVQTIQGPLLIFAGAGSGKTRVISNRIAHMIQDHHIPAGKIVALSFTNKSAKEMGERVRKLIPRNLLKGITLSTFHSLGLGILKKHIEKLEYKQPFLLLNQADQEGLVTGMLVAQKLEPKRPQIMEVLSKISRIKNSGEDYLADMRTSMNEGDLLAASLFQQYQDTLKEQNSIDFDDLILLPSKLLRQFEEVRDEYHKKFQYFMVDEFQDTNPIQYEFLRALMGESDNLCVVGDDDQSIYAFRGSDVSLILGFENDFKGANVIRLLENYRSTDIIVSAANSLIRHNLSRRSKELFSKVPGALKVKYVERSDEKDEAEWVADSIREEIIKQARKGSQIAILFRTNFQSRPFEEAFRAREMPYKVVGGYNFFDRKEVRDLISYIRLIANQKDDASLLRIINYPKRGIGAGSISLVHAKAAQNKESLYETLFRVCESPDFIPDLNRKISSEIYNFVNLIEKAKKKFSSSPRLFFALRELIADLGLEKEIALEEKEEKVAKARIYNMSELVNMLAFFEENNDSGEKPTLFDFINRLAMLMEDEPNDEKEDNRVQLLTIHQSKGLEFESVYVVGLEEGILPSGRATVEDQSVDEERRLMYVAMTRAKRHLCLTGAANRRKFGEQLASEPSRFLKEIDPETLDWLSNEETRQQETSDFLQELEKLKIG
ncbi:damage-inducible protein [Leptospira koniambonensis]|uniref:DNA 3'-5' helicase n=1 Tax=Leptospira koniambonensis TaxID=2484950 RepID=A0A4R9J980_9LEPT|nr:damage-inducible protein [Leptospira koniambonensis]